MTGDCDDMMMTDDDADEMNDDKNVKLLVESISSDRFGGSAD